MTPPIDCELYIFDLDGTLVDSQHDLATAVNNVRASYGESALSVAQIRAYVGSGVKLLVERALPGLSGPELEKAIGEFREQYDAHLLDTTVLFPGIRDTLESLARSGRRCAVLTNKPELFSRRILSALQIDRYFAIVWGGDTGPRRKPDPDPVVEILSRLSVPRDRSVLIGDGVNDILAAKAAGVRSLALGYGYSTADELKALRPDYFIASPGELRDFIRTSSDPLPYRAS